MDVVERTLYNGFLSGVSLQGDTYFYPNPLSSDGRSRFNHDAGAERSPWFGCSCCPANSVRFVPSVPGYMYAVQADGLYINLFAAGSATVQVGEQDVTLTQQTAYPWGGRIELSVTPEQSAEFTVRLRIPGWARDEIVPGGLYRNAGDGREVSGVRCQVSGQEVPVGSLASGYLVITRAWEQGDTVVLDFPMAVRRVVCDEKVESNRGRAAFERGPLVYCAEGADHDGHALNLWVPDDVMLSAQKRDDLPGKPVALMGQGSRSLLGWSSRIPGGRTDADPLLRLVPPRGQRDARVVATHRRRCGSPSGANHRFAEPGDGFAPLASRPHRRSA